MEITGHWAQWRWIDLCLVAPPASRTFLQACSFIIRDGLFGWAFVWPGSDILRSATAVGLFASTGWAVRGCRSSVKGTFGKVKMANGRVDRHMDQQQHGCNELCWHWVQMFSFWLCWGHRTGRAVDFRSLNKWWTFIIIGPIARPVQHNHLKENWDILASSDVWRHAEMRQTRVHTDRHAFHSPCVFFWA